jgi:hypothetical protein
MAQTTIRSRPPRGVARPRPDAPHPTVVLAVNDARRAVNRARHGLGSALRCECTTQDCRDTLPAEAEAYRGIADRYVVAPAHLRGGVVVRAADRFFVVELRGDATRHPGV